MDDALQSNATVEDTPENVLVIQSGNINPHHQYTELWMPSGQVIRVSTELLTIAPDAAHREQSDEPSTLTLDEVASITYRL